MKPRPQHTSVSPTVLVDIGDTLISRTVPGPCSRVEQALTAHGVDTSDPDTRLTLARCLLTGQDRGGAAAVLSDTLSLPARTTAAVHAALRRTEGQARILPGARTLLAQARQAGWNVIAVTNAAQWMPALPAALNRHVSDIVSSADVGLLKHDPEFWRRIIDADHGIDEHAALVIGDNPRADGAAPSQAGLCSIVHAAAGPSLTEIADWIAHAAPAPATPLGLVAARSVRWAGHTVVAAPHLSALLAPVTRRRVRAFFGDRPAVAAAQARRRDLTPVLIVPESHLGGLVWLTAAGARRDHTIPADLHAALDQHSISVDGLSDRELMHLTAMVREAADADVRRDRIASVVQYLQASQKRCTP